MLDFNKARNLDVKIIAVDLGIQFNKYNKCCCIVHNEKTPSMSIYNNRLKCHVGSCGASLSTIDLYCKIKGLSEIQGVKELLNKYTINYIERIKKTHSPIKFSTNKPIVNNNNFIEILINNSYKINSIDENKFIKEYLTKRCIPRTIELLRKNNVDIYYNNYKNLETICFYFKENNFMIRKGYNKQNGDKIKLNCRTPNVSFFSVSDSKDIYICEGIEDALSFMHVGRNVISLNSTSNSKLLLKKINNWKGIKEYKFIIATDNDNAGIICSNELKDYFIKNNIRYDMYNCHIKANCNDINELWIKKCTKNIL